MRWSSILLHSKKLFIVVATSKAMRVFARWEPISFLPFTLYARRLEKFFIYDHLYVIPIVSCFMALCIKIISHNEVM